MVKLYDGGVYLVGGETLVTDPAQLESLCGRVVAKEEAEKGTLAYGILAAHNESGDMEHLREVDDNFHDMLCKLSRRTVIQDTLLPLLRKTRRFRRISMSDPDRIIHTQAEHRQIYDAIVSGDAELAKKLTTLHITNAKEHMIGGLKHHG